MRPEFLITSLIVVAAPGTGVLYTLAAGLSRGARASVVAAFGCTLGIVPHMAAAILGLAALLHASAVAFQIFKYVGVAYLLYLAWMTLKEHGALKVEADAQPALRAAGDRHRHPDQFPQSQAVDLLHGLPAAVHRCRRGPSAWRAWANSAPSSWSMTFVVFVGYGLFAAAVRDHVISRPRVLTWMRRTFAAAFVALGVKLAFADR